MNRSSSSGSSFYIIAITVVATLGGLLFGFDSGVINGTVEGLQTAFNSDSAGTGFNVASILLGCAVGAFFAGRLADPVRAQNPAHCGCCLLYHFGMGFRHLYRFF